MCPRSQTIGLMSGLCWRVSCSSESGSISSSVRARVAAMQAPAAAGRDRPAVPHSEEEDGERLRRVDERARGLEAEARRAGGHLVHLELPADLGEDHLAPRDAEAPPELREVDHLLAGEAGVDLD